MIDGVLTVIYLLILHKFRSLPFAQWLDQHRCTMNYRHVFHAGNHADVFKHVVLARVLKLMQRKDKAFAFVDAHAGAGIYDLLSAEASKTLEWQEGISKMTEPFPASIEDLLADYRQILNALNRGSRIRLYPGSPWLASCLLRPIDRMYFNDLHSQTKATLEQHLGHDKRVTFLARDAQEAIKAVMPVKERRAAILIDPSYESENEIDSVVRQVQHGLRRLANATVMVWYPIKSIAYAGKFKDQLKQVQATDVLGVQLMIKEPFAEGGLAGSGVTVFNPPWMLDQDLQELVPALASRLGIGTWGRATVEWLAPPT
jgi:23S rRNA (adenine2030-N6)-methyltransferase